MEPRYYGHHPGATNGPEKFGRINGVVVFTRDRGATLRLGDTVSDSILGGGGGRGAQDTFFSLILYNFKYIRGRGGRGRGHVTPGPPAPRFLFASRVTFHHLRNDIKKCIMIARYFSGKLGDALFTFSSYLTV